MSEFVSISEFLNITKLREHDVITMLENGELAISTGPLGELLIDLAQVTPEKLAKRSRKRTIPTSDLDLALIEETVASEVTSSLDSMVDEALHLALRWLEQDKGTQ